jgi:membrane protein implicated in regulation of membrane protease activity
VSGQAIVWLVVAGVGIVVELLTTQLFAGYLAVGALVSLATGAAGASEVAQVIVFAVASLLLIVFTRNPLRTMLYRSTPLRPMNTAGLIGNDATVTAVFDPPDTGQVRIGGEIWKARTADGTSLVAGRPVTVQEIEGVTAVVGPRDW